MLVLKVNEAHELTVSEQEGELMLNEQPADWDCVKLPNGLYSILYKGRSFTASVDRIDRSAKTLTLTIDGKKTLVAVREPIDQLLDKMGMSNLNARKAEPVKAPMPGMILKVLVAPGQTISKGDGLLILEAMKMENVLKAQHPGIVKNINVAERTAVEKGAVLIEME